MYKQVEDGFSNPNGNVNKSSLEWLCSTVKGIVNSYQGKEVDLLELYCGGANHTVALSAYANIVAVELNKSLCEAAIANLSLNRVGNLII